MKNISINNGMSFCGIEDALAAFDMVTLAHYMDDDAREATAYEMAPCSNADFLRRYLELAPDDLVIG